MSVEALKSFFDVGTVILLFLTFAFGAGVLVTGNIVNVRQAKELGRFSLKLEEEQQKTALAQKEAAEAKKIAGGFEVAISTANQRAAEANAKAEGFRLDIAKQQERAANAERSLLQLKESLKGRTLSSQQKENLAKALAGKPQGSVEILWMASDADSYPLVLQIMESFKSAGWSNVIERMALSGTGVGLGIQVHAIKTAPEYAVVIQKAFSSIGLELAGSEDSTIPEGTVRIWVGHKPQLH